jgi:hypothetical protein
MAGGLLRSVSARVTEHRRDWTRTNPSRARFYRSSSRRIFDTASDQPLGWAAGILITVIAASIAMWKWPPPYQGWVKILPDSKGYTPGASFFGLWAVQVAVVAVVYPLVVAFITILISDQKISKTVVAAYFAASAAKLTGVMNLTAVTAMSVQFIFLDQVPALSGFGWLILDGLWFTFNALLTLRFLIRTFEFSSPEARRERRNKYIVTRAFEGEWKFHVSRHLSQNPALNGLLSIEDAVTNLTGAQPGLASTTIDYADEDALNFKFKGEKCISNIRFRFIEWAFMSWKWRAEKWTPDANELAGSRRRLISRTGPFLQLTQRYADRFFATDALIRQAKGPRLSFIEKAIFSLAFSTTRRMLTPQITVLDGLGEAMADVTDALRDDDASTFNVRLLNFLELYGDIIEVSLYSEDGKQMSYALLPDATYSWSAQPLIYVWQQLFVDLMDRALTGLERRSTFSERAVRTGARCAMRLQHRQIAGLVESHITLQFQLGRALLNWGEEKCSSLTISSVGGVILTQPNHRHYESVLREAVSAWESLKNDVLLLRRYDIDDWDEMRRVTIHLRKHLMDSARLVSDALAANDRLGYQYWMDSLLRWIGQLENPRGMSITLSDRFKVTVADTELTLSEFRQRFPLPDYMADRESDETLRDAWMLGLKNHWRDTLYIVGAQTLMRAQRDESLRGLAGTLVKNVFGGQIISIDAAAQGSVLPFQGTDSVLASLIRQLVLRGPEGIHYSEQMERVADSLIDPAVIGGISGRMYPGFGSAMDAIADSQLLLIAFLANDTWNPARTFAPALRVWDERIRRRLEFEIGKMSGRLSEPQFVTDHAALWTSIGGVSANLEPQVKLVKDLLEKLNIQLTAIRNEEFREAEIDPKALEELRGFAMNAVPEGGEVGAPFDLFQRIIKGAGTTTRTQKINGFDKGRLTLPRMADTPVNENDYIEKVLRSWISFYAFADAVEAAAPNEQVIATREQFVEVVSSFGKNLTADLSEAILIVSSRADPPWLLDLYRDSIDSPNQVASMQRLKEFDGRAGYVGHIGDTAVFTAPIRGGTGFLCSSRILDELQIFSGRGVRVTVNEEKIPSRCTLTFEWEQSVSLADGQAAKLVFGNPE